MKKSGYIEYFRNTKKVYLTWHLADAHKAAIDPGRKGQSPSETEVWG
jgi:hypothetical protein